MSLQCPRSLFLESKYLFKFQSLERKLVNCHAVGMAIAQPLDFEIDFARNPLSGSAASFFVILKSLFRAIFEIKVLVKNS